MAEIITKQALRVRAALAGYLYVSPFSPSRPPIAPACTFGRSANGRVWRMYNSAMALGYYAALWQAFIVTLRALWRVVRQVFHEATGAMFAIFAIYGGMAVWRQYKSRPILWLMFFAAAYAITMATFAYFAFRRARKVR
jgi:hypothetical protein